MPGLSILLSPQEARRDALFFLREKMYTFSNTFIRKIWTSLCLYIRTCTLTLSISILRHKYQLDFSPVVDIICDNFRQSKALRGRMIFNWEKIAFCLGKVWERYYHLSQRQKKKDKKITSSKTLKRIKSTTEDSNLFS